MMTIDRIGANRTGAIDYEGCSVRAGRTIAAEGFRYPADWPSQSCRSPIEIVAGNAGASARLWTALLLMLGLNAFAAAQTETTSVPGRPLDMSLNAGYTYDDNVTRAPSGPDKLTDQFYSFNGDKRFEIPAGAHAQLVMDVIIGGALARSFAGLGNIFGEVQGELQYRASSSFDSPTLAVFGRAIAEHYGSTLRSGYRYSAGISALQPVTDRITLFGALAHNWRYAESAVFSTRENAALLNVDYSIAPHGTVYLTGEYRRGTVVSTGQPTLQILDIAELFVKDDVFTSPQMIDYRFEAKNVLTTLGYNLPLGARSSLDFSWKRVQSTSTEQASFPGGGSLKYIDNQYSVVYLVRF